MPARWYKCSECAFAIKHVSANGSGAWCSWQGQRDPKQPLVFYGKTAPKTCPLKMLGVKKEG